MAEDGEAGIALETLTRLWLYPKYLYRVLDHGLTTPVNLRLILWAGGVFIPSVVVFAFLGVKPSAFANFGLIPNVVVPFLIVRWVLTKVGGGAKPWEMAWGWTRLARAVRRHPDRLAPDVLHTRLTGPCATTTEGLPC